MSSRSPGTNATPRITEILSTTRSTVNRRKRQLLRSRFEEENTYRDQSVKQSRFLIDPDRRRLEQLHDPARQPAHRCQATEGAGGQRSDHVGHGQLGAALLEHGLLDEPHFAIHPVFVGEHTPLLGPGVTATLELTGTTTCRTGVVVLSYKPKQ